MKGKSFSSESDIFKRIISDQAVRRSLTQQGHLFFFSIYFASHIEYEIADFQKEMFNLTEDSSITNLVICAFRGSAKSTIMTLSLPLWAVLGKLQKKHVLIFAQTMPQAKQHLKNIREELEGNSLLRSDLGPFHEESDEWRSYSLVIPRYGARITAASIEQSVRGMKHKQYRPDLVIFDDVEDINSVKTQEGRDKLYDWVMGDVMPSGDKNTRFVFVGNLLHEDSLIMRIRKNIEENRMDGVYREYPLIKDDGTVAWPGKYPSQEDIEAERKKIGSEAAYQRELNLKIMPGDDPIVKPEWIHRYDTLPCRDAQFVITGIDAAISKSSTADYTAMVSLKVFGTRDDMVMYVLPNPVNERLDFPEQVERIILLSKILGNGYPTELCPEDVGYQKALVQTLKEKRMLVHEIKTGGLSKETRLRSISYLIKEGRILFPREGAESMIRQILMFGYEKHDDLVDALVYAVIGAMEKNKKTAIFV